MRIFNKIKTAVAGGVFWLTVELFLKRVPAKLTDEEYYKRLCDLHTQTRCFKIVHNLEKKYRKKTEYYKCQVIKEDASLPHEHSKIIWILWLQGIENAPPIVRMCYQSVLDRFSGEYQIITLNENNIDDYISLPEFIKEKYRKGYITRQCYSDLIRYELLDVYGGTWMDATIFYSGGEIPEHIMNSDLFVYQTMFPATWGIATVLNSYFITSCQNNKIIKLAKLLFYDYWKHYNVCCDYWLVCDFFEIARKQFEEDWLKVVPEEPLTMHILQDRMKQQFNAETFENTVRKTPFHKLLWKFDFENVDMSGTYYEYLMTHYPIYEKNKTEG